MHSHTTDPAGSSTVGIVVGVLLPVVVAVFMVAVLILVLVLIFKQKRKRKASSINTGTVGLCSWNSDTISLSFSFLQHNTEQYWK